MEEFELQNLNPEPDLPSFSANLNIDNIPLLSNINEITKKQFFNFIKLIFTELNITNKTSIIAGLHTASTDSALMWMLNENSINLIVDWLKLHDTTEDLLKYSIRISAAAGLTAVDLYSARGLIDKVKKIAIRKHVFPKHFSNVCIIITLSIIFNAISVIGPVGLTYRVFENTKIEALYFSVSIALVNILSVTFFITSIVQEIQKFFIDNIPERHSKKKNIVNLISYIVAQLNNLDRTNYHLIMCQLRTAIQQHNIEEVMALLNLNSFVNQDEADVNTGISLKSKRKKTISSFLVALFPAIHIAWLHYAVGTSSVAYLLNSLPETSLEILKNVSGVSLASVHGTVGLYSAFMLSRDIFNMTHEDLTLKNSVLTILNGFISIMAAMITLGLVSDHFSEGEFQDYMYVATWVSMFCIYSNAISKTSLSELFTDIAFEVKAVFTNIFYPAQEDLARRTESLITELNYIPQKDLAELSDVIDMTLHSMTIPVNTV